MTLRVGRAGRGLLDLTHGYHAATAVVGVRRGRGVVLGAARPLARQGLGVVGMGVNVGAGAPLLISGAAFVVLVSRH